MMNHHLSNMAPVITHCVTQTQTRVLLLLTSTLNNINTKRKIVANIMHNIVLFIYWDSY